METRKGSPSAGSQALESSDLNIRVLLEAMPLPYVKSGKTPRCTAKCKARGDRCWNPAVTKWGCTTCRYHGAKNPETIKRGANHPQYRHGQETLEAKAERSQRLGELRELEVLSFELGLAAGPRWRGRKPTAPLIERS